MVRAIKCSSSKNNTTGSDTKLCIVSPLPPKPSPKSPIFFLRLSIAHPCRVNCDLFIIKNGLWSCVTLRRDFWHQVAWLGGLKSSEPVFQLKHCLVLGCVIVLQFTVVPHITGAMAFFCTLRACCNHTEQVLLLVDWTVAVFDRFERDITVLDRAC